MYYKNYIYIYVNVKLVNHCNIFIELLSSILQFLLVFVISLPYYKITIIHSESLIYNYTYILLYLTKNKVTLTRSTCIP